MNVFEFAMKMEEDGKAYYLGLAERTAHPGLKTVFARLAEDEQKHFETFRTLQEGQAAPSMEDSQVLEEAKNVFEALPTGTIALKGMADALAGYDHAMDLEAQSFKFYERAAREERDPGTKELLTRIAVEERKHYNILENIYSFINAPNQSLDWAEFSNLSEFSQFGREKDI
ncbi:MAG: ferritin family protein [Desulfuromonadales bacterium]|nr:ferritin family protein [Desulfuromonadales bacterium]